MTIHFGILGLGNIANRFATNLQHHPEAELTAVASANKDKQNHFIETYHAKWATDQYSEIINSSEIDVIYIANQHKDHAYWVEQCLLNHKAVLCKKPMALTYKQTKQLIDLAKKQHTFLMEAVKGYFEPAYKQLRQDLSSIGQIKTIEASFNYKIPLIPGKYLFEKGQGGALNDVGIYPLSFVDSLINEPVSTIEVDYRQHPQAVVDSYFKATLHYPSGCLAIIEGAIDEQKERVATITGTDGTMTIPYYYRMETYTIKKEQSTIDHSYPILYGDIYGEIDEVIQCLKNNQIESKRYPHQKMLSLAKYLEDIRNQIILHD